MKPPPDRHCPDHSPLPAWEARYPELSRLRAALAHPDPQILQDLIDGLAESGHLSMAAAGRVMAASRTRDWGQMKVIAGGPTGDLLRREGALHYGLIWSLYCAGGITAASEEIQRFPAADGAEDLFPPWRRNLMALGALARRMAGKSPEICCPRPGIIPLLKGTTLPMAQGAVNGAEPGVFIVDTGAPSTLLSKAYARKTGVDWDPKVYREGRDGAGNSLRLYPGVLDRLVIGEATCTAWPVLVADLAIEIAGILSPLELFRGRSMVIDWERRRLQILPTGSENQETGLDIPIRWNGEQPFVKVRVDGRTGWFLLDTGAGANLICMGFAHRLEFNSGGPVEIESPTAGGRARIQKGGRRWFAVGDESEVQADFLIKECPYDPVDLFPALMEGYVGTPWFGSRRIRFSGDRRWLTVIRG